MMRSVRVSRGVGDHHVPADMGSFDRDTEELLGIIMFLRTWDHSIVTLRSFSVPPLLRL
jgi:hypothetical protein